MYINPPPGVIFFSPGWVGEGTVFFAFDWLEGLSSDWLFDLGKCVCVCVCV